MSEVRRTLTVMLVFLGCVVAAALLELYAPETAAAMQKWLLGWWPSDAL